MERLSVRPFADRRATINSTYASGLTWHRDWFKPSILGRVADKVRHMNMDRPTEPKPQCRPDVIAGEAEHAKGLETVVALKEAA